MGPFVAGDLGACGERFFLRDAASVSQVREALRALSSTVGLSKVRAESLVTAASEIGHNQLAHARQGEMAIRRIERAGVVGVEVLAMDRGKGIANPTVALTGGGSETESGSGLGIGLGGAYRLADEVDFDVRLGEGTFIAARKFGEPVRRQEVAVLARPCPGEEEAGDDALFAWNGDDLFLAVADGLGHGPVARAAARDGLAAAGARAAGPLLQALEAAHAATVGTRGTVLALSRYEARSGDVAHAAVGNVSTHLQQDRLGRRFLSAAGFLGAPQPRVQRRAPAERAPEERMPARAKDLLVMFTDGLSSRLDLGADLALLREPPLVVAHALLTRHGRDNDDALILVARL